MNEPKVDVNTIEQTRRQIQRLFEEVSRLSELDLPPADYFGEFLKRVLTALAAPAGAVWMRTPQGNLQLQFQVNLQQLGLNRSEEARQSHDELLRLAFQQPRPIHLPPQSFAGQADGGATAPGNPTDCILLLVPIQVENQVDGLLEVWQSPDRNPAAINGFMQFMTEMSGLASRFLRNRKMRQMEQQQGLWGQLENFSRQIHSSLNPTEVAYLVANEGRRLIDCDRVSVGLRWGKKKCTVEAVSGADVVEKRSNLVQLMKKLFDRVLVWNEKLVYTGTKDDTLPPDILAALDAYLGESNSKLLVVQPLRDEREKDKDGKEIKKPARSIIMMECFEPTTAPDQLVARVDVIGKHAASALYNSMEHKRIPFRFLWAPLAKVQEGLGGKARAITFLVVLGLAALTAALIFVPMMLQVDSTGQLLPEERVLLYSPVKGFVQAVAINDSRIVNPEEDIILIRDQETFEALSKLDSEISTMEAELQVIEGRINNARASNLPDDQVRTLTFEKVSREVALKYKRREREERLQWANVQRDRLGSFWLKAPRFDEDRRAARGDVAGSPRWTVLTADFKETLPRRPVDPKEPLLRLGNVDGNWEIELKIPQKHIGQVLNAYSYLKTDVIDVELIVKSEPTKKYLGKLRRDKISSEAMPHQTENNESEPVVLAWVRIEPIDGDIPPDRQVPRELMLTGTEVKARLSCGRHAMGYSLFYPLWEFLYEKAFTYF